MKEIHVTFKRFLFFGLMTLALGLNAQTVTLKFTGRDNDNHYMRLSKVVVNNLTKNWQETIWWPDTTLVMQNGTGIDDYVENGVFFLSQNNPNPFSRSTDVSLNVVEEGKVYLEILDLNGRKIVETQEIVSLPSGLHQFRLSLSTGGTYVMTARQNSKSSSIKMICNGGCGTNAIDYLGEAQSITYMLKSSTNKPFNYGDMMEYIGYATINGSEVESQRITQVQGTSQTFTLQFAVAQLPNPPTGVTATVSGTQILVSWDPVPNATEYMVYHSSYANGSYSALGWSVSSSYYDVGPLIGYNYYRVKAMSSAGESDYSSVASCNYVIVPEVTPITAVINVTSSTATCGGNVSSDGGATVTSRGVCWGTSPNPTVSGAHTSNGSGTGLFSSNMTGLAANTMYYVRAYATNSAGTNYGAQTTFTTTAFTCGSNTTDYDGNSYNTVQIGSQCWMKENLKATNLNNATPISLIQDSTTWASTSSAAYCYYNISSYGCLYNFYAVSSGLLCPPGWHVPSYNEVFGTLYSSLGGTDVGGKMKTTGTLYWQSPNTGATNSSEFSARGGGCRPQGKSFYRINTHAVFWTTTNYENNTDYVKTYCMAYNSAALMNYGYTDYGYSMSKRSGLSVRCVSDEVIEAAPGVPTGVTATLSGSQIYISWNSVSNATSYKVYRSSSTNGTYSQIGSTTSTYFYDSSPLTGYNYYKIKAVNSSGESDYSTYDYAYYSGGTTVPDAPTGLTVALSGSQIYVSWNSVSNATSYKVYRSSSASGYYTLISSPTFTYYFDDSPMTGYNYYKIKAVNSAGESDYSTYDYTYYSGGTTVPDAPTGVTATNVGTSSSPQIEISWYPVSDATSYKVYRSSSASGTYSLLGSTSYTYKYDNNPLSGHNYYKVKAVNAAGESSYSSYAHYNNTGGGGSTTYAPCPPTISVSGTSSQTVSWTPVINSGCGTPTSYEVYHRDPCNGGTYELMTTTTSTSYHVSSSNVHPGINRYIVKAINSSGSVSNYAASSSVSLSAPSSFTVQKLSGGYLKFTWSAVSKATGYQIFVSDSPSPNSGYMIMSNGWINDGSTTTATIYYPETSGTTRYFKMKAFYDCGDYWELSNLTSTYESITF